MPKIKKITKENVSKMVTIVSQGDSCMNFTPYKLIKLAVISDQLCMYYEDDDGKEIILPIARRNTIKRLFQKYDSEINNL